MNDEVVGYSPTGVSLAHSSHEKPSHHIAAIIRESVKE